MHNEAYQIILADIDEQAKTWNDDDALHQTDFNKVHYTYILVAYQSHHPLRACGYQPTTVSSAPANTGLPDAGSTITLFTRLGAQNQTWTSDFLIKPPQTYVMRPPCNIYLLAPLSTSHDSLSCSQCLLAWLARDS